MLFLGQNVFENKEKIQGVFLEPLFTDKKKLLNKIVTFDPSSKIYYYFILISRYRIPAQESSAIEINFQPIIDPEMTFKKTSSIMVEQNFTSVKKPFTNFIIPVVKIITIVIVLFLLSYFKNFLKKLLTKLRLIFLIIAIFSVAVNIIIINWPSNVLFLPSLFFWILSLIGYDLEERTSLYISLAFLMLCPLFISIKNTVIADKLAIYAYLFLLTGGTHSLISYMRRKYNIINQNKK